jgi:hypothetical protein
VRDAEELKEHPFFKTIDWVALSQRKVTPPFKPVVESDESTANFDPEFTSADIRDIGVDDVDLDEEDPSEDWISHPGNPSLTHTYNGPLGSDRERITHGYHNGAVNGSHARPQGIQIKPKKNKKHAAGSPLTKSVQENFRGFTYSGGESLVVPPRLAKAVRESEEAVADEEVPDVTTEDEYEDSGTAAGRYANARRKGALGPDDDLGD